MKAELKSKFRPGRLAVVNWIAARDQSLHQTFMKTRRYMGRWPDAAVQTRAVNDAFYKAAREYKKGVVKASRTAFKNRTKRLRKSIGARKGKLQYRPSAIVFLGGRKRSRHRNLIEHGKTNRDGSRTPPAPYVRVGLLESNLKARVALSTWIRTHADEIVFDANRIANRG